MAVITFVAVGLALFIIVAGAVIYSLIKSSKAGRNASGTPAGNFKADTDALCELYTHAPTPPFGYARFLKAGAELPISGKFYYKRGFQGIAGEHFAFYIQSEERLDKAENPHTEADFYSFILEIGYFDGIALDEENHDNGVIFPTLYKVNNSVRELNPSEGYVFTVSTEETDEVERGKIRITEFTPDKMLVDFKLFVPCGLCDVIVGSALLLRDTENYD